jgi:Ca-activated chloride channel family protein
MTFGIPVVLPVAAVLLLAAGLGYRAAVRRRRIGTLRPSQSVTVSATAPARRHRNPGLRRHLPYLLFLAALAVLLFALSRPTATVPTLRASGTVILAFDVSNSMSATDVAPSRLGAAQAVARTFVQAQPDSVDIGVVAFGQGGFTTVQPTNEHADLIAAIDRLQLGGATSLAQAILTSLGAIAGRPVSLPRSGGAQQDETAVTAPPSGIGYRADATIVLLSDGENTAGPDAQAAAELAATAGVHIQAVGVGTVQGAVIGVDGFQLATALNAQQLMALAQTTGGNYYPLADASQVAGLASELPLRTQVAGRPVELTSVASGAALLLLTAGALLMIRWHGRVV